MAPRVRVFLDTSVLFAAVLSPEGGSRLVLKLGEAGLVDLLVGPSVLAEMDEVVARKARQSLPLVALLLDAASVEVGPAPSRRHLVKARTCVSHAGDAAVLAEAMAAEAGWLLTRDKRHLLRSGMPVLPLTIGTPGDLIAYLRADLLASE